MIESLKIDGLADAIELAQRVLRVGLKMDRFSVSVSTPATVAISLASDDAIQVAISPAPSVRFAFGFLHYDVSIRGLVVTPRAIRVLVDGWPDPVIEVMR
jgi:hypothetical protein